MGKMTKFSQVVVMASVVVASSLLGVAQQTNSKAAEAIRKADQDWMAAFATKDANKAASFVASDGAVYSPNAPSAQGTEAVVKLFNDFYKTPDIKLTWTPTLVEAAKSGDLGFSSGTYEMTFKDPSGKMVSDHGKYVTVWQKQHDGSWKAIRDIFNSDLPSQATQ